MFMYGLGIPLGVALFAACVHYITAFVSNPLNVGAPALGVCLALCSIYACRGIDIIIDRKKDNPPAFGVPKNVTETFTIIMEEMKQGHMGPFFWNVRETSTEDLTIFASLSFSEQFGGISSGPMMLQRMIMLQVDIEPVTEEEYKAALERPFPECWRSKVKFSWSVDSPYNRVKCNEIIKTLTTGLKARLEVPGVELPREKHPMEPPVWLISLTVMSLIQIGHDRFVLQERQRMAQEQREQWQAETDKRELAAKQQQQKATEDAKAIIAPAPTSNNLFSPYLGAPTNPAPAYSPQSSASQAPSNLVDSATTTGNVPPVQTNTIHPLP